MDDKKGYLVKEPLKRNGKKYMPGDAISLTEEEAAGLLDAEVILPAEAEEEAPEKTEGTKEETPGKTEETKEETSEKAEERPPAPPLPPKKK